MDQYSDQSREEPANYAGVFLEYVDRCCLIRRKEREAQSFHGSFRYSLVICLYIGNDEKIWLLGIVVICKVNLEGGVRRVDNQSKQRLVYRGDRYGRAFTTVG